MLEFLFNWRENGIVSDQGAVKYALQMTSEELTQAVGSSQGNLIFNVM